MPSSKYKLSNQYPLKRAFVSNATSGLGKAICMELARDGWTIGISGTNVYYLDEVSQMIMLEGGVAIVYSMDVAKSENYEIIAKDFLFNSGGIDLLINNTGLDEGSILGDYTIDAWQELLGMHQMSVVYGCHYFMSEMIRKKSGYVINVVSAAAFSDYATMAPYNMAKAAVISISQTIRKKFRQENIGVSIALLDFFTTNEELGSRLTSEPLKATSVINPKEVAKKILAASGNKKFHITFSTGLSDVKKRIALILGS